MNVVAEIKSKTLPIMGIICWLMPYVLLVVLSKQTLIGIGFGENELFLVDRGIIFLGAPIQIIGLTLLLKYATRQREGEDCAGEFILPGITLGAFCLLGLDFLLKTLSVR